MTTIDLSGETSTSNAVATPGNGQGDVNPAPTLNAELLFPNSFKVTGIKHICDNLVGAILENMPQ